MPAEYAETKDFGRFPRPNLFLIGAMKSGSSTLAKHLRAHPSIFMARYPKEPSYFVERQQLLDVAPVIEKMGFWKSEERYLELFADAGDCPVVGEASQNYARLPRVTGVPERIAKFNPAARFLYIMRDPVERTISHYWYMVNFYGEGRKMLNAVQEEADYRATSYYAMQLRPYIRLFGAESLLTLTLEEMREDPVTTMRTIYRWLEVDENFVPPALDQRANVTSAVSTQVRGLGLLHRLRHSSFWDRLGPWVPPKLRHIARSRAEKRIVRKEVPTEDVEAYLRPIQREQTEELEELLRRSFPEWRTLYAS